MSKKNVGDPKGGKYASRGSNAEGPNNAGITAKGGVRGVKDNGKVQAPNKGGFNVIDRMNKTVNHTTSMEGSTHSR